MTFLNYVHVLAAVLGILTMVKMFELVTAYKFYSFDKVIYCNVGISDLTSQ